MRLFDRLFNTPEPDRVPKDVKDFDYKQNLNPQSLEVLAHAKLEPSVQNAQPGDRMQFERLGYFCVDPDSRPEKPVFNRTVTVKDTWAKELAKGAK